MQNTKNNKLFYIIVFAVYLLIYVLSISKNASISHDSIHYLLDFKSGYWNFHPHHLLYHVFNQIIYELILNFNQNASALFIVSSVNSVFGALTMVVVVKIFRDLFNLNRSHSLIASAAIGFSYGVWYYSACVEVYIIPLFFVVLSYYYFFKSPEKTFLVGLFAGFATLFHQSYVFLMPMYLLILLYRKSDFKSIFRFSLVYSIVVGVTYILVLLLVYHVKSISEGYYVLTKYAHDMPYHWSSIGAKMLFNDLVGFGRVVFSIHYLFGIEQVQQLINKTFPHNYFNEEIYLVRNISKFLIYFLSSLLAVLSVTYLWIFIKGIINYIKSKEFKLFKFWGLIYILIFGTFFTFWSSNNPEFWISIYTILMITFIRFLNFNRRNVIILTVFAVSLFFYNLFSTFYFTENVDNDYYLSKINNIADIVSEDDLLVYDNNYRIHDYLQFNDYPNTLAVKEIKSTDALLDSIQNIKHDRVFLIDDVFTKYEKMSAKYINFKDTLLKQNLLKPVKSDDIIFYEVKNKSSINLR